MPTRDLARATLFFTELFGWQFTAGARGEGYGHIANTHQLMGMNEHDEDIQLSFRVDDMDAYVQKLESLGGTVLSRRTIPMGELADCEDDQGFRFALHRPATPS
jgi:predicted enzyme related to lactoylglutathione lyase